MVRPHAAGSACPSAGSCAVGVGPDAVSDSAKQGDDPVGGIFDISGKEFDGVPESWMSYLAVDDVDARVKKAVAAGAKLMRPIFDVADVGRIAILTEPGGAAVGWITPKG